MMHRVGFITGIFLYLLLLGFVIPHYKVFASDMEENVTDMQDDIVNFEDLEDLDNDNAFELTDTIRPLSDYSDANEEVIEKNDTDTEETMDNNDQFRIMVIFSLGIISGVIIGTTLVRFIP